MKLVPGTFMGTPLRRRSASGLIFTEYRYDPLTHLRAHSHELAYFSFVLGGSYEEKCSSTRPLDCRCGTALYHPADERHSDHFGDRGGHIFSIEVPIDFLTKATEHELTINERVAFNQASFAVLRQRAYSVFLDARPSNSLLLQAIGLELLCQLPWKRPHFPEPAIPHWLRHAIEIVHAEFRNPFSLLLIAERVGTHPVHLARTFKHHRGVTIGNYVRHLRLSYACELLSGDLPLDEIATEAGFADQSHFGRLCKAATGMTPGQLRSKTSR